MQAHLFLVVFYQSLTLDYYNVNVFILQWFTTSHVHTDIVNVFYVVPLASAYFTLSIRPNAYTKWYTRYGAVMQQLHVSRFAKVHTDHIYGPILGAERLPYRLINLVHTSSYGILNKQCSDCRETNQRKMLVEFL